MNNRMTREEIENSIIAEINRHGTFTDHDRGRWFAAAKRLVAAYPALELVMGTDAERPYVHNGRRVHYRAHWTLKAK